MFHRFLLLVVAALMLAPAAAGASLSRSESALLREMNRVRTVHGMRTLRFDARLERAARSHSRDMTVHGYFAHGAFGARMRAFGVQGSFAGENLAWGVGERGTARGIVRAWLASPGHRANLLHPSFRRVGVGALVTSFSGFAGATVVTADFAG
jgi:uncharacterized protein YkwD